MSLLILATLATGLFAGAAIYINLVEHPARVSCGAELAIREFGPSYKRAAVMQAALAMIGSLAGIMAAWQRRDPATFVAARGERELSPSVPLATQIADRPRMARKSPEPVDR